MIKSISYEQQEIIDNILKLYCPSGIECDPTYSKGVFYKNREHPKFKFDLNPQTEDTVCSDCRNLPLLPDSINSIMFDPPFICGSTQKTVEEDTKGILRNRFGYYKNIYALWEMYEAALKEFYRVLKKDGVLIFKCQDTVDSSKQCLSEFKIIKEALALGFYPKDKFILIAKHRLVSPHQRIQQHSRKFHSYFLVFIKQKPKIAY